jgi:hypothetical protein
MSGGSARVDAGAARGDGGVSRQSIISIEQPLRSELALALSGSPRTFARPTDDLFTLEIRK